jgi:hypothetical protein
MRLLHEPQVMLLVVASAPARGAAVRAVELAAFLVLGRFVLQAGQLQVFQQHRAARADLRRL